MRDSDDFYLGAYWGPRAEDASQCAERLANCLLGLAAIDEAFAGWKSGSDSRPLELDIEALAGVLRGGRHRDDSADRRVMGSLGFTVALANDQSTFPVSVMLTCGSSNPRVSNAFSVRLPRGQEACTILDLENAKSLLKAAVGSWDPSWATLTSHQLRQAQDVSPNKPVVGWLTYLSSAYHIPPLPAWTSSEVLVSGGLLIVTSSSCDDSLTERVAALAASLG